MLKPVTILSDCYADEAGNIYRGSNDSSLELLPNYECKGYKVFSVKRDGKWCVFKVHRAVAIAFNGDCPPGKQCAHLNGDKGDNRAENLKWVTPLENSQHKKEHGTMSKGAKNGRARLGVEDVRTIWHRYWVEGVSCSSLAAEYGVYYHTVAKLVAGETWGSVTGSLPPDKKHLRFSLPRKSRGETQANSKLTERQVEDIWYSHKGGAKTRALATAYGVSWGAISDIVNGDTWVHITSTLN